jgi:hypothetical protein
VDSLEKLKQAYQEAKNKLNDDKQLSDILINPDTGDFTFVWDTEEPDNK